MILFIGFMLYLAFRCSQQNIDLVAENYYEKEVKYQQTINAIKNVSRLEGKVSWQKIPGELVIKLPFEFTDKRVSGNIYFLRSADKTKDRKVDVEGMDTRIPLLEFMSGPYHMQMDWTVDNKNYYYEELIVL